MDEKTYKQSGKTLTSEWQQEVLSYVASMGSHGVTDAELQGYFNRGHGSTSSALSTLHKRGHLARLKEKRNRFTVYVATKYVGDRETLKPMTAKGDISEVVELRKKLAEIEELVKPKWRSYSYTRDNLLDDIRRVLL